MSLATPAVLQTPQTDLAVLSDQLGCAWGVSQGKPLIQYLAWSDSAGVFSALADGPRTLKDVTSRTELNIEGADVLTCILVAVGLLRRGPRGTLALSVVARDFFIVGSPYYVGVGMFAGCDRVIPSEFTGDGSKKDMESPSRDFYANPWTIPSRLRIQHSRNFAPSVIAARTGEFDHVEHLVDVAGGSGVLAIPLALDHPNMKITLIERPEALEYVGDFLDRYGIRERVTLVDRDLLNQEWNVPRCDGIFFGNFFHANDDEACAGLARQGFEQLSGGGRIWIHEVLFSENRDGPLIAALWNANMFLRRPGARQRTALEITRLLTEAGFAGCYNVPTAGGFSMVTGKKK